ncbi:hypothetical protein [Flaviflexus massiliensis]|uniref:hypothetical protein n=1 Tax=Flaviflexus massiliensis TaxID=1522309 RepID=UPI00164D34E3|nr:hypothetical protein [Flaviflexus massiliensis]
MENLLAVLPSILALGAFAAVMRLIMNSDRLERKAEAELDAQEAAQAPAHDQSAD